MNKNKIFIDNYLYKNFYLIKIFFINNYFIYIKNCFFLSGVNL